ncbi:hypothetical protein L210DRAFT_3548276 [Boletus edulis BED1]|uniref:Uncharacterized protein n=1 Tax=Boletus edulis BED1 TaxID=1328754 RepID=A0AAD4BPW8_BOLED|nr:hypothetical protein L210DRAFT_3548276 [Boletus edulis BED1]
MIASQMVDPRVSAVDLHFYKVPMAGAFSLVEEYESSLGELSISELGSPLRAARKLESIFVPQPQEDYLHLIVIIDAPLRITCWVRGADVPLQLLNVELQKHALPLELSSRVKELLPALADVALSDLKSYTLSTKNDDELKEVLDCKRKGSLVCSGQMMKDAFDDVPFSSREFKAVIEVVSHQTIVPPSSSCLVGEGNTILRARQKFLRDNPPGEDWHIPSTVLLMSVNRGHREDSGNRRR